MFTLKGINVAIGFVIVPLTLNYLDPTRYGIWITISAIFNWFSLFDIGLGSGLRNRLAEALAKNDIQKARIYISTTYVSLIVIFIVIFVLFLIANVFIDWTVVLNTSKELKNELRLLASLVFFFFCMRFITQLITVIALAKQEPAFSQMLDVSGRIVSLIGIYLLTIYTSGNLLRLGITLTALPAVTVFFLSIFVFNSRYKELKPALSLVRFKELRYILNLGVKFFIIQIAGIVFYQTNNIIIAQFFGPAEVTPYVITYQYLSSITIGFSIILTPYWSAFTEAYAKKDFIWIKKEIKKLKYLWIALLLAMVITLLFSRYFIGLWVGKKVVINMYLALAITLYLILTAYNSINCSFLNGTGKIKIQLYIALAFSLIHIPLAIYFCHKFGLNGIMFSAIINTLVTLVVYEIQYRRIISNRAVGIWNV
ncbi:MAG: oligosaccharide flippase family protein [Bacteroidetes bacterium]|nr:oligosaccharide flippase family protein [Bacteroidota bacterium]